MSQIFPYAAGRSIDDSRLPWVMPLFLVFAVYLLCALIVPTLGKTAAGFLLLIGLASFYQFKLYFYDLIRVEKWLLASYALFSIVSITSFFYWPKTDEARMHLEDYATFITLLPLYLLLRQFSFKLKWVVVLFALVAVVLGCVSMVQFMAMKFYGTSILSSGKVFWLRPSGDVNPMRYGAISLVIMAFSLNAILVLNKESFWFKLLLISAVFFALVACLLTQVRGSWIAIFVLLLAYTIYLYRSGHTKFLMILMVGVVFAVVSVYQTQILQTRGQLIVSNIQEYQQGNSQTNIGARLDMFKAAGILIKQKPFFGHGLNSYSPKATEIRNRTPGMSGEVGRWANPHNEILQVMVEKGVIGLITLLLLFGAPGYLFLQALNKADDSVAGQQIKFYAMSGLSLLIVFAVAGQSVALFEHDVFNHFFALMVLLFASQIRVIGYMEENSRFKEGC
jgi:O-antigen ligase